MVLHHSSRRGPRGRGRPWASRSRWSGPAAPTPRSWSRAWPTAPTGSRGTSWPRSTSAARARGRGGGPAPPPAPLRGAELALFDVDGERLSVVGGLAGRMLARVGWGGRLHATGRREGGVDGADFVVVQLRVGGQAMRLVDETLPLEFGCIGQETTGPGGFAKALRTVPVVLELAEETARRGAPGAWFVDFTNPVGIVTQALLDRGHRAVG